MNTAKAADFYSVTSVSGTDGNYEVVVRLKADHKVYNGHFPGNPIAPGVLLTDMVRRVAGTILGREMRLTSAGQIKFLQVVNPNAVGELTLNIKLTDGEHGHSLTCSAINKETTYFKLIGELV